MPLLGTTVGNIRILERLGRGGMGDVYVGFDEKLHRRVALKVIRHDRRLDTETRARFLREARILSQLDDPKICRIFDYVETGADDFLVLELIEGEGLRKIFESGRPSFELALSIAEQLADVLVAAHSKGVIHRDLKPDNVMVTASGGIKVLDFGLARNVGEPIRWDGGDAEQTRELRQRTELGVVVGTPSSMSPEQARGEAITAASDMFSYGLLLQELFTGESPYERGLPAHALLLRASHGATRPVKGLDRDLSSLIQRLKALQPEDRPSAREARDRLRWIRDRPRRRWRWALGAAIAAVLCAAGVKVGLDLEAERRAALAARADAEEALAFVVDLFELADPTLHDGQDVTAREILDEGARRVRDQLADRPLSQARLLDTIGSVYRRLGLYAPATELLADALALRESQLAESDPVVAESLDHLAVAYWNQGRYDDALALLTRAAAILERHPAERLALATVENDLANVESDRGNLEAARPLYERSLATREELLGAHDVRVGQSLHNLGVLLLETGHREEAAEQLGRALGILRLHYGATHPSIGRVLNSLGRASAALGRDAEASDYYRRAIEVYEAVLGPDHPLLAWPLVGLADLDVAAGRDSEAEPLLRRALAVRERTLPEAHPDRVATRRLLLELLRRQGRDAEAAAFDPGAAAARAAPSRP